jgi:TolB-like protein/DNA-binding winged helix-turn-helix (wHTH) protein/Tfp pilus assembly protein PilF
MATDTPPDRSMPPLDDATRDAGFRLGRWTVRPRQGTVEADGQTIHLEPRVMAALVCLARQPGETVTREEFIREVWMGRVVSDEVLSRCISILRSTFDDSARSPQFIQTIPKVGYRLIAGIEPLEAPAPTGPSPPEPAPAGEPDVPQDTPAPLPPAGWRALLLELRRRNVFRVAAAYGIVGWFAVEALRWAVARYGGPGWLVPLSVTFVLLGWPVALTLAWLFEPTRDGFKPVASVRPGESVADITGRRLDYVILGALVGALILALFGLPDRRGNGTADAHEPAPNSVAVLPFTNLGPGDDEDYLSDGLSEELMTRLAAVPGLTVAGRTSSFAFKGRNDNVRKVARRLGVEYVVDGSVRREGDHVRITAQLVDATRGYQLWSRSFDGTLQEIFTLQDEIAMAIVSELPAALRQPAIQAISGTAAPTASVAAYELLLRGKYQLAIRDEEHIRHAIRLFRQALDTDPSYADAWTGLAKAQALLPSYSNELPDEMYETATATLAAGAQQSPQVATQGQDVTAYIAFSRWQWLEAQRRFDAALALKPGDSDLLQWYSQFLSSVGRRDESLDYALRARSLDVLSPVVNERLAVAYMWSDQDELAERQFQVSRELGMAVAAQPDAYLLLLLRRQRFDEARELAVSLQRMFARPADWLDPFVAFLRGEGSREDAVAALAQAEEERDVSRRYAFGAWMMLGEHDRALRSALELARDPIEFEVEFVFSREARGLRQHPRFGELVGTLGLDAYWDVAGWPPGCQRQAGRVLCE